MVIFLYAVLYLFFFIVGACIGSFLNVVIYRLPKKISICKGRSFCPSCGQTLSPLDLVPVFSWLFLKGKCRYCGQKISFRYPLGEAICGLFAVFSIVIFGFEWHAAVVFASLCVLYCVAWIDADTMEIPDSLIIALIIPAICAVFTAPEISLLSRAIGFAEISIPLLLMALAIKGSFGGGDIKLCAAAGFLLGWKAMLLGAFLAIVSAGAYAIICLAKKTKTRREHFAFGPFLSAGIAVALMLGDKIINAYISLFFG